MASLGDLALVTQVAVFGNKRAFDTLVRRHQSLVRRFFLHQTLGNAQLSDDLAQDTFVKAWLHIGQFRATAAFSTWLMRIAYNVYYDYRRSLKTEETDIDSMELHAKTADAHATDNPSLRMDIRQALSILRPEERVCITLQLIDGQPIDHISRITGMPANTVKSHLKRGKQKLTDYLRQNGYD